MDEPTEQEIDKVVKYLFRPENREWDKKIDDTVYVIQRTNFTEDSSFYRVAVFKEEES